MPQLFVFAVGEAALNAQTELLNEMIVIAFRIEEDYRGYCFALLDNLF